MNIIESNGVFKVGHVTGIHEELPQGNYLLKFDPREGYYLVQKPDFKLPSKIYGNHSIIDRWLKSYKHNSEKNLGIVLAGIKGSGKTITAQKFCIESKMAVIIINEQFYGSDFIDFITQFNNVIIFIDEFEKVYADKKISYDMLSLMDGNYQTKMIFLLTVNELNIDYYLTNRLNRLKYKKDYIDLDRETVDAVIEDLLINKNHRESIYKFFKKVNMWTFDLLVNIIKEMNLFNEDAIECGQHLNLAAEVKKYEVWEQIDGKMVLQSSLALKGDAESFYFHRNNISASAAAEIAVRSKEDSENYDSEDYWTVDTTFKECKITELPNGDIIIENSNFFTPLKVTLKLINPYKFTL